MGNENSKAHETVQKISYHMTLTTVNDYLREARRAENEWQTCRNVTTVTVSC